MVVGGAADGAVFVSLTAGRAGSAHIPSVQAEVGISNSAELWDCPIGVSGLIEHNNNTNWGPDV
jgi:hypothetical protein